MVQGSVPEHHRFRRRDELAAKIEEAKMEAKGMEVKEEAKEAAAVEMRRRRRRRRRATTRIGRDVRARLRCHYYAGDSVVHGRPGRRRDPQWHWREWQSQCGTLRCERARGRHPW